jgi:hypothetical protein
VCAKGSWYDTDGCKDDLTPQWPDANYQDEEGVQLVGPECRGVVCTDHTQCVHIYYTVRDRLGHSCSQSQSCARMLLVLNVCVH